jgi:hypothetical protein
MNNKIVLGVAALALATVAVKSLTPVLAYKGDPTVKGPNYSTERHETNVKAFESNNYEMWAKNMQGRGVTRFVNQSNFKEFASAQVAAQKGDSSKLTAFRAKYGMGNRQGAGMGMGHGRQ